MTKNHLLIIIGAIFVIVGYLSGPGALIPAQDDDGTLAAIGFVMIVFGIF